MFSIFKKNPPDVFIYGNRFIDDCVKNINSIYSGPEALPCIVDLSNRLATVANEFGVPEPDCLKDKIHDLFLAWIPSLSDPKVFKMVFMASVIYDVFKFPEGSLPGLTLRDGEVPDHLQVRLLTTIIEYQLADDKIDSRELDPDLQQAFYDVESKKLPDEEAAQLLEERYGIFGWKSRSELNFNPYTTPDFIALGKR